MLARIAIGAQPARAGLNAATMRVQHGLDVKLALVAEMIVDRRHVGTRPVANRANPRGVKPLAGEFLTSRFEQTSFCRILVIHRRSTPSKQMFQTAVLGIIDFVG